MDDVAPRPLSAAASRHFRALATAELRAVLRFARQLASRRDSPEDLVQETYLRAFRSAATFQGDAAGMRSWLFKILHNVHRTRRRNASAHATDPLSSAADLPAPVPLPPAGAPLNFDDLDESLARAVRDLPDDCRVVFLLVAAEGLRYREAADVLDIPIGTIMSRLSRARALLIAALENKTPPQRVVPKAAHQNATESPARDASAARRSTTPRQP